MRIRLPESPAQFLGVLVRYLHPSEEPVLVLVE
jgi:hypothetical protein